MLRVDQHVWIGEEGESPLPEVQLGFSSMTFCSKCHAYGDLAWFYIGWPRDSDRFMEMYLCRGCLAEAMTYTERQSASRQNVRGSQKAVASVSVSSKRGYISPRLRFEIFKRDGYRCQICGEQAGDDLTLHLDHKVAVAVGGSSDPQNLWVLCSDCNLGKGIQSL